MSLGLSSYNQRSKRNSIFDFSKIHRSNKFNDINIDSQEVLLKML